MMRAGELIGSLRDDATLDGFRDGINGRDLGVIGESQYALTFQNGEPKDVWRRKASEVGTYGGWRWECSADHPRQYASHDMPVLASLTARIALASKSAAVSPSAVREG